MAGVMFWKSTASPAGDTAAPAAETPTRASDRSHHRDTASRSGTDILKLISPHTFTPPIQNPYGADGGRMTYATYLSRNARAYLDAADKLEPASDIAAAAIAAIEKSLLRIQDPKATLSPEDQEELQHLNSRLIHWLRQDPATALQHLSGIRHQPGRPGIDTSRAVFAAMKEQDAETVLNWWKNSNLPPSGSFQYLLTSYLAGDGDPQNLITARNHLSPREWDQVKRQISGTWPFEKADALLEYAISENSPDSITGIAFNNGKEGADWLMRVLESEDTDPAFKESILKSQQYRQILANNPHLPLDTRIAAIAANEPGKDPEQIALELGSRDVTKTLNESTEDWRFKFRHGKATFEEIYEAVAGNLPELASGAADGLRLGLFKELAEDNGPAALEALAHTPEPDKWTVALKPTQWMFYNINPQEFYDYLQNIPHQEPEHHQARFESWVSHSSSNLSLYSRDYVHWVKALPEGIDREMAAIGILRSISGNSSHPDHQLIAEMDSLVTSPDLRERIKAPPPRNR